MAESHKGTAHKAVVLCHCCKRPATDRDGKPKRAPICHACIQRSGSTERPCALHHPEYYDREVNQS